MDPLDRLWAYCGQRAVDRHSTTGVRVHAVGAISKLSGAMDAECGEIGRVSMGDWDPGMAHACPDCIAILEADRKAAIAAKLAKPAPRRRSCTPSLFASAA